MALPVALLRDDALHHYPAVFSMVIMTRIGDTSVIPLSGEIVDSFSVLQKHRENDYKNNSNVCGDFDQQQSLLARSNAGYRSKADDARGSIIATAVNLGWGRRQWFSERCD